MAAECEMADQCRAQPSRPLVTTCGHHAQDWFVPTLHQESGFAYLLKGYCLDRSKILSKELLALRQIPHGVEGGFSDQPQRLEENWVGIAKTAHERAMPRHIRVARANIGNEATGKFFRLVR